MYVFYKTFTQTELWLTAQHRCCWESSSCYNPECSCETLLEAFTIMCDLIRVACNQCVIYNRCLSSSSALWVFAWWGSVTPRVIVCVWLHYFESLCLSPSIQLFSSEMFHPLSSAYTLTPQSPRGSARNVSWTAFCWRKPQSRERERELNLWRKANDSITGRFVCHYLWICLSERNTEW